MNHLLSRVFPVLAIVLGLIAVDVPAMAADPKAPGSWRGYAFDTCRAPSVSAMKTWWGTSEYKAVGIYTSGNSRACPTDTKDNPNLTPSWVQQTADMGWSFIPIHVGYQAPCFTRQYKAGQRKKKTMSYDIATARQQGISDANEAIAANENFGFGQGSVFYLDIESYPRSTSCDAAVLNFIDAWTQHLHDQGYKSGLYSSGGSAIKLVSEKRTANPNAIDWPDHIWIARWSGTALSKDVSNYLSPKLWTNHQRIHQFTGGTNVTHGGVKINIDKNFMDVGKGSPASSEPKPCGVQMSWSKYPTLKSGSKDKRVLTLQCLLVQAGAYAGTLSGKYDTKTIAAVKKYRGSKKWKKGNGKATTRNLWTSLLSQGSKPSMLKYGSTGESVWRLQRALNATLGGGVTINGVYNANTTSAVKKYRKRLKWKQYPTAPASMWTKLHSGR